MNKFIFLASVFLISSLAFATCPGTISIDQEQTQISGYPNSFSSLLWSTPSLPRSMSTAYQLFIPSTSGELPRLDIYGKKRNQYSTSGYYYCPVTGANEPHYFLDPHAQYIIAQAFTIDAGNASLDWGSVTFSLEKYSGTSYDNIVVSIQADSGGHPDGTPLGSSSLLLESYVWNVRSGVANYKPYSVNWGGGVSLSVGTYWLVFEVSPSSTDGVYNFEGGVANCSTSGLGPIYYSSGLGWYGPGDGSIRFELIPIGSGYSDFCIGIYGYYSGFLGATRISLSTSSGWSVPGTYWYTSWSCSPGTETLNGPTLTAEHVYYFVVNPIFYSDVEVEFKYGDVYSRGFMYTDYFGNPSLTPYYNSDLAFKTYKCDVGSSPTPTPSVTPTPSPTPTLTAAPTGTPIPTLNVCASTRDCSYGYNCDIATHTCYPRARDYQSWGNYWIELFFNWNTGYVIIAGTIILLFFVALPFMSNLRDE